MRKMMSRLNEYFKFRFSFVALLNAPQRFFLVLALFFGLGFVFLFPPFQAIDEPTHFYRAYQIAQGDIIGVKKDGATGGYLPSSVIHSLDKYGRIVSHYQEKANIGDVFSDLSKDTLPDKKEFIAFNNTVIYPPLTYLPQVIGIKLSMIFSTSALASFYFARLVSLLVWVIVMFMLIKCIPIGKWTLTIIGLFPMVLSQAASVSSDATINTATLLVVGVIIMLIFSKESDNRILQRILLACAVVLSLVKLPTLLILLLALAIPAERFNNWGAKGKVKFILLMFFLAIIATLMWNYFALNLRVDLRPEVSASEQMKFVLSNPLFFLKLFILYPLQGGFDQTIVQVYGWLGWNEIRLPVWLAFSGFFLLFLSLFDKSYEKVVITKYVRIFSVVVGIVMCVTITTLLYLTWMPVGYGHFYDLWGRYYVVFLVLLIPAAGGLFTTQSDMWKWMRKVMIIYLPIMLLIVTVLVTNRYYGHMLLG